MFAHLAKRNQKFLEASCDIQITMCTIKYIASQKAHVLNTNIASLNDAQTQKYTCVDLL